MTMPIGKLSGLSTRTLNALVSDNIAFVRDVMNRGKKSLQSGNPALGESGLAELEAALARLSLTLPD